MGIRGPPNLFCFPAAAKHCFFTIVIVLRTLISRSLGKGHGVRVGKNTTSLLFLLRFRCFSWGNTSGMDCKSVVNFQSSKKVDFDSFCLYSCCFYGWVYFQRSLVCHSGSVPTLPVLIIVVQNFNLKIG